MKKNTNRSKMLLLLPIGIGTAIFIAVVFFLSVYYSVSLDKNKIVAERANIVFLDNEGKEIKTEYLNRYVKYENINSNVINAFVALEDKRFFEHNGVDYYRTAGALINNLKSGSLKEGGSTITQQLAKNTQLTNEKTIFRKIKEMRLARQIENSYKKEDILEMYLNAIYYGNGIYGIDAACKKYFGKTPSDISVPEAAILAGIVKNPSKYSPLTHPQNAETRMKLVLRLLYEQKYISEREYDNALRYRYENVESSDNGSYFVAALQEAARYLEMDERDIIRSDYTIETYYDKSVQNRLIDLVKSGEYTETTEKGTLSEVFCAVSDNQTGGIIAYYGVGKTDLYTNRQPGSTIKPLVVYTPALEQGVIRESDRYTDERKSFGDYSPKNYNDVYLGEVDVETAVKQSINTVAVEIYSKIDKNTARKSLDDMGIRLDESDDGLALSLGGMTYGTSGKNLLEGYSTLANGGIHCAIGVVKRILSPDGKVIFTKCGDKNRVFSEDSAYIMTDMLQKTARLGTAKKLARLPFEVAAKTGTVGTADGNTDAWCVSFCPQYSVIARVGTNENDAFIRSTGGGLPTMLTEKVYRSLKPEKKYFNVPDSVVECEVDLFALQKDGILLKSNENTPKQYRKRYYYQMDTIPTESSPYFNEAVDFSPEVRGNEVKIRLSTLYPFSYRVVRESMSTGTEKEIAYIFADILRPFDKKDVFDKIETGGAYRYRIDVIFNGDIVKREHSFAMIVDS